MIQKHQLGVYPPTEMFEDNGVGITQKSNIGAINQLNTPTFHAHYPKEGGVLVFHEGDKYPTKAWPFKEAVLAVDTIKRAVINTVKFMISSPVRYFLPLFFLLPGFLKKKIINNALEQFTDYTNNVFTRWEINWKPIFYCDMVREIYRVASKMARESITNQRLVRTICNTFEFDDAYRYFVQDGLEQFSLKNFYENPAKELQRVFKIIAERSDPGAAIKFEQFSKLIPFLFWIKEIREPIIEFFSKVDIEKLKLDEMDWYRSLVWGNHKFGNISAEERMSMRIMIDAEWKLAKTTSMQEYNKLQNAKK